MALRHIERCSSARVRDDASLTPADARRELIKTIFSSPDNVAAIDLRLRYLIRAHAHVGYAQPLRRRQQVVLCLVIGD